MNFENGKTGNTIFFVTDCFATKWSRSESQLPLDYYSHMIAELPLVLDLYCVFLQTEDTGIKPVLVLYIEVLEIEGALPKKAVCKITTEQCTNHPLGLY